MSYPQRLPQSLGTGENDFNIRVVNTSQLSASHALNAALVIAEVLSLEAALFSVPSCVRLAWRSCMRGATSILAIRLGEHKINAILKRGSYSDLSVACINCDRACVLSGLPSHLHNLTREFATTRCTACLLDILYGYHSQEIQFWIILSN